MRASRKRDLEKQEAGMSNSKKSLQDKPRKGSRRFSSQVKSTPKRMMLHE
jgi:hypothetical protein